MRRYKSYKAYRSDYTKRIYDTFMRNWVNYIKFGSDVDDLEADPVSLEREMREYVALALRKQLSMSGTNRVLIMDMIDSYLDQVEFHFLAGRYIESVIYGEPV